MRLLHLTRRRRGVSTAIWIVAGSVLVGVVEAGQPGGQPLDGDLEVGVEVDELLQPRGQPGEGDRSSPRRLSSSSMPRSVKYTRADLRG